MQPTIAPDCASTCHCLGLGCAFCSPSFDHLVAARANLHAEAAAAASWGRYTHTFECKRLLLTPEQAREEQRLYCQLFLLDPSAKPITQRPETNLMRVAERDCAMSQFLHSQYVEKVEGSRVPSPEFADAFRQFSGLNATQHAISQAARRAGLKSASSHGRRFLVGAAIKTLN
jgi:hypothetical protein